MFSIEQSPFLHALGYAIGHSLWQMSLLWLVYAGLVHLHKLSSSQRYILAVSAATAGFGWFLFTFFYYANLRDIPGESSMVMPGFAAEKTLTPGGKIAFIYHSFMATLRSLAPYFSCAYLVVMLVLSIRLANGFNQVKKLRSQGLSKPPVDWRLFISKHAAILGIKRPVKFFISEVATSPLTMGFWKPFILIPLASLNQLTPQQMEAVLLHELAHIKRYDYLFNILLQLAEITLFFNPFMLLLLKQARVERENSCDDFVLQFQYNAAEYAKALLVIEQNSIESLLALGSNNRNEFQLLNRIKRMVAPERKAFNYRQQLSLLFIITILGLGFTMISPKNNVEAGKAVQEEKVAAPANAIQQAQVTPKALDLIKNLESLKETARDRTRSQQHVAANLEAKALSPAQPAPVLPTPATVDALQIAGDHLITGAIAENLEKGLQAPVQPGTKREKTAWSMAIAPLFGNTHGALAMLPSVKEKDWVNLFGPAVPGTPKPPRAAQAPAAHPRVRVKGWSQKEVAEMEELHADLYLEQQLAAQLAQEHQRLTDSLRHVIARAKDKALVYEKELAKAKKAAVIAPFRIYHHTGESSPFKDNISVSGFNLNEHQVKVFSGDMEDVANDYVYIYNEHSREARAKKGHSCECPKVNRNQRSSIAFDGRAVAEKVKKVWTEAQKVHKNGWTEEMQQEVMQEIEKELKTLENFEIKTRISTRNSNSGKTIVIEVETAM